jgi:hypothetical protein
MSWRGKVTKTGSSGSVTGWGELLFGTSLTAISLLANPVTLALRTFAINTTIDNRIGVSWTWGASASGNTVTTYLITTGTLN